MQSSSGSNWGGGNVHNYSNFNSPRVGNFNSVGPQQKWNTFGPQQKWNTFSGNAHWNEHGDWNHYRSNQWAFDRGHDWWRYNRGFFFAPWWDLGFGWWYPYYYSNFWWQYPSCWNGTCDYATYPYYMYVNPEVVSTGDAPGTAAGVNPPYTVAYGSEDTAGTSGYYAQAVGAFQSGDYRGSLKQSAHAAIDNPQDPGVHLLLALSMFAQGNYDGAAMEAHAIAAMGKTPDWATLYGYYGNIKPFTDQLTALEKDVGKNPTSPTSRFLLGFLYLSEGHKDAAQTQLLKALTLETHDRVAANLLVAAGGQVPANIAQELAKTPKAGQGSAPGGSAPGAIPPPPPAAP
jgi:hypothetical protein